MGPPSAPPLPHRRRVYQIRLRHQYLASLGRPHLHSVVGGEHLKGPQMRTLSSGMCLLLRMYVVCRRCAFCCVLLCVLYFGLAFTLPVPEAPSAADRHLLQIASSWRSEGGSGGRVRGVRRRRVSMAPNPPRNPPFGLLNYLNEQRRPGRGSQSFEVYKSF